MKFAPVKPAPLSWAEQLNSAAAFAVPGLALWLASGYSYGAVLLLIGAVCTLHRWPRERQQILTGWLAVCMFAMALMWVAMADPSENLGKWDRPAKFILAIPCLLYTVVFPPRPKAFFWGLVVGCIGAGAIAMWQVYGLHEWRASGRTNAIQYGNLALLLAVMLAVYVAAVHKQLNGGEKVLAVIAVVAGMDASVLSLSRGGWLALLASMPFALLLLYWNRRRLFWRVVVGLMIAVGLMSVLNRGMLATRWDEMTSEIRVYETTRNASTSVGQRLEHWRFAIDAGLEKPVLGWGFGGYMEEKQKRVSEGRYQPAILEYKFVHNELLDVFVKTGLVGVCVLLWFYFLPLWMFWPTRKRMQMFDGADPAQRRKMLALRMCGVCVPVLYMGFGLTQVFFAHNSGIMFYLFSIILLWSMVQGHERTGQRARMTRMAARAKA